MSARILFDLYRYTSRILDLPMERPSSVKVFPIPLTPGSRRRITQGDSLILGKKVIVDDQVFNCIPFGYWTSLPFLDDKPSGA